MHRISRDPFARTTLIRRNADLSLRNIGAKLTCCWCGNLGGGRNKTMLYEYGTEHDAINPRVNWHRGMFCSKSCHDSYHS